MRQAGCLVDEGDEFVHVGIVAQFVTQGGDNLLDTAQVLSFGVRAVAQDFSKLGCSNRKLVAGVGIPKIILQIKVSSKE